MRDLGEETVAGKEGEKLHRLLSPQTLRVSFRISFHDPCTLNLEAWNRVESVRKYAGRAKKGPLAQTPSKPIALHSDSRVMM